ncbi:MAG: hypothetical protein K2Y22_04005 [Candidatus Obscuribacterales bacterium]|nr:hypothetical protein [Candidatus Obscuribacterales bacterium]
MSIRMVILLMLTLMPPSLARPIPDGTPIIGRDNTFITASLDDIELGIPLEHFQQIATVKQWPLSYVSGEGLLGKRGDCKVLQWTSTTVKAPTLLGHLLQSTHFTFVNDNHTYRLSSIEGQIPLNSFESFATDVHQKYGSPDDHDENSKFVLLNWTHGKDRFCILISKGDDYLTTIVSDIRLANLGLLQEGGTLELAKQMAVISPQIKASRGIADLSAAPLAEVVVALDTSPRNSREYFAAKESLYRRKDTERTQDILKAMDLITFGSETYSLLYSIAIRRGADPFEKLPISTLLPLMIENRDSSWGGQLWNNLHKRLPRLSNSELSEIVNLLWRYPRYRWSLEEEMQKRGMSR